jgi:large subunit ribosomal protein L1
MSSHGKKYVQRASLVEKWKVYPLLDWVKLLKEVSYTKFDPTVEVSIKTFANPKYNDQMMRGTMVLPYGTGKAVKVAVYVNEDMVWQAKSSGADIVWSSDLIKDIESGSIKFDILVTTPELLRDLAKVAKVLWPKGLMPNIKTGTVTTDIAKAVNEIKKWRVEYKLDKTGNIQMPVGKGSFSDDQLAQNISTLVKTLEENKPTGVKGRLIKKIVVSTTMSPAVLVSIDW